MVDGINRLLKSNLNEPCNIGNPHEITLNELAETIIKISGSKSKIVYKSLPVDDPKVRRPDITKAQKFLRWQPKVSLKTGLAETIEYFRGRK
jgi:dTDP-glucose 4,6-dehydratase